MSFNRVNGTDGTLERVAGLGIQGPQGDEGFSPSIAVKTSTSDEYVLTVTNEDGSYDTPNLKGGADSEIWKTQTEMGAKNILPYPYLFSTRTKAGLTATVNSDGSVTIVGTPTETSTFFDTYEWNDDRKILIFPKGRYVSSITGQNDNDIRFTLILRDRASGDVERTIYKDQAFEISENEATRFQNRTLSATLRIDMRGLVVGSGINVTVYPMIRSTSFTDGTWAQYSLSNIELSKSNRTVIKIDNSEGINGFYNKMLIAFAKKNCDVHIGKGDYVYTNEFVDSVRATKRGVPIGGNNRYFFETGANILCHYTGSNQTDVKGYFSPLDSQNVSSSYEIYNLNLKAKNVCYGLHDEANGEDVFCRHVYKDCYIEIDNTEIGDSGNTLSKAIGGGLGKHEEVIIENCVFKATNPLSERHEDVSYHGANNSTFTDASIIVANCWFEHTFRTSDLGNNVEAPYPRLIFVGNSLNTAPVLPVTWSVKEWNNEIRQV